MLCLLATRANHLICIQEFYFIRKTRSQISGLRGDSFSRADVGRDTRISGSAAVILDMCLYARVPWHLWSMPRFDLATLAHYVSY